MQFGTILSENKMFGDFLPLQVYCTILTNSLVTGHKAFQSEELVLLSQVTLPSKACDKVFLGLLGPKFFQNWQFQRGFGLVTLPDGSRRDAHLFVVVTGHKPRRVGRNGTVYVNLLNKISKIRQLI